MVTKLLGVWDSIPDDEDKCWDIEDNQISDLWAALKRELEYLAELSSAAVFLKFAAMFSNNKSFFNLDDIYLHLLEAKPDYPPASLYEDTSDNDLVSKLRDRCFREGIIVDSSKLPVFTKAANDFISSDTPEADLGDCFTLEDISKMTTHEVRLTFELAQIYAAFPGDETKIEALIKRIGS